MELEPTPQTGFMATESKPEPLTELPAVLRIIEGTLDLDTQEDSTAYVVAAGLKYYLSLEFARQQPALALLYDLEFHVTSMRPGSRHVTFKIWVRLKERVRIALDAIERDFKKSGVIACMGLALQIPGAINETGKLFDNLRAPTEQRLQQEVPQYSPSLTFTGNRVPNADDESPF